MFSPCVSVRLSKPFSTIRLIVFREEDRDQPKPSEIAEWISPTLDAPEDQRCFRITSSEEEGFMSPYGDMRRHKSRYRLVRVETRNLGLVLISA